MTNKIRHVMLYLLQRAHGRQDGGDHGVQHGHREGDGARHGAEGRQSGHGLQVRNFTPFTPSLIS